MKAPRHPLLACLRRASMLGVILAFAFASTSASMIGGSLSIKVEPGKTKTVRKVANPTARGTIPATKAPAPGAPEAKPKPVNKNAAVITQTSNEIFYTITVINNSPVLARGVTVQYIIYNQTSTMKDGKHESTIEPITGADTVDVPANGKIDVDTVNVSNTDSETTAKPNSKVIGTGKVAASSKQEVQGYVVMLKFENAVVQTVESTPGIKRKMDAQIAANSGAASTPSKK